MSIVGDWLWREHEEALDRWHGNQRVSYETRLAARQAYENWEQQVQLDGWDRYLLANMSEEEFILMRRGGVIFRQSTARQAREAADVLLYRHLSPQQQRDLLEYDWFDVEGKGKLKGRLGFRTMQTRRFRIFRHGPTIEEIMPSGAHQHLCVMSTQLMPQADIMLAMKLLIEADVARFLKTANRIGAPR